MATSRSWLFLGLLLSLSGVSSTAQAREPAYRLRGLAFHTSLHGVKRQPPAPTCPKKICGKKVRGKVVAAGGVHDRKTDIAIEIREYRLKRGVKSKAALKKFARFRAHQGAKLKESFRKEGTVGTSSTIAQWVTDDRCERVIHGRLLVALPHKIVEVETATPYRPKRIRLAIKRMGAVLKSVRIRRFGQKKSLMPKGALPAAKLFRLPKAKKGCLGLEGVSPLSHLGPLAATCGSAPTTVGV